jgi:hypothetical protein
MGCSTVAKRADLPDSHGSTKEGSKRAFDRNRRNFARSTEMSVTFSIRGIESNWETGENWVNFSNVNARSVIDIVGIRLEDERDIYGEITDMDGVIRRATRSLNSERYDYGTPRYESQKKGCARVIEAEVTDESMRRRIKSVLNLCVEARRLGKSVIFG